MLDKIRDLFKKKEEPPEPEDDFEDKLLNDEVSGSITYYFREDSDDTYMDIHLSNYEDDTLTKFAKIISGLSSLRFQLETLNMIKGCFQDVDDERIFNKIVVKMIEFTEDETNIIEQLNKDSKKKEDQPWIKPSDLIK